MEAYAMARFGVMAQTSPLSQLPNCAVSCLVLEVENSQCALTNQTCVCTNVPLQDNIALCVTQNCTVTQALTTKNITETVCEAPIRDRGQMYNAISISFGVISGFVILLRLGFRAFVAKIGLGMDDWLILLTIISGVPSTVIATHGTIANGLGRDIWTLTPDMITNFGRFFYVMAILYFLQVMLLKMSLLFFYLRVFPSITVKRLLRGTLAFNVMVGVLFVLLTIFQCQPISYFWTQWDGEHQGTCLSIDSIAWSNAVISITLDLWMLAIPISQLRILKIHWKMKIGVALMFSLGTFVTVVSIIRLYTLVAFADSQNPTWDDLDVSIWSTVEINVGIICACLPSIRLILVRILPFLGGSSVTASHGRYYHTASNNSTAGRRSRPIIAQGPAQGDGVLDHRYSKGAPYNDNDETKLVHMRDLDVTDAMSRSNLSDTLAEP